MDVFDIPGIIGLGVHVSVLPRPRHHCTQFVVTA
jgi:hypothetical protein